MQRQDRPRSNRNRNNILAVFILLMPALVFQVAFLLKQSGTAVLLRAFFLFDRLFFDIGDFFIGVCLPLLVLVISIVGLIRHKDNRMLLGILAIIATIILVVDVAGYLMTDALYESRGESIYE